MKILLINVTCRQGSTGKIAYDLYAEFKKAGHKAAVCYGRGPLIDEPDIYKFTHDWEVNLHALKTRLTGYVGKGNLAATRRLIRYIESFNPDVVHLQNIHGYYVDAYKLLSYLKQNVIPTVITMHDEWLFTGKCGYPYGCEGWRNSCGNCPSLSEYPKSPFFDRTAKEFDIKRKIFCDFNNVIFVPVSVWLKNAARQSQYLMNKHFEVIHNGIDTEVFMPTDAKALKKKLGLGDEKVLLHVTPNFDDLRKGGKYILDLARRLGPEIVKVIIVGAHKPVKNSSGNIIWIPKTEKQKELAAYYSLADIFILTSEMESLPTVCLEALCCGTPVAGFDCGGTKETAPEGYGVFVPYGNMEELERVVGLALKGEIALAEAEACAEYGRRHYGKETMGEAYLKIYDMVGSL